MNKETEELHEELQDAYAENRFAVQELIALAEAIRGKISGEEWQKLEELSKKIIQLKKFAKKSISAVAELSRSQRKATREAMRDFNELAEL
ncbi:MAG TPA: hypothetical protein VFR70_01185 [Flavobacterium sp.]|nr:hypothetical protein [Flavobacterium sp.]